MKANIQSQQKRPVILGFPAPEKKLAATREGEGAKEEEVEQAPSCLLAYLPTFQPPSEDFWAPLFFSLFGKSISGRVGGRNGWNGERGTQKKKKAPAACWNEESLFLRPVCSANFFHQRWYGTVFLPPSVPQKKKGKKLCFSNQFLPFSFSWAPLKASSTPTLVVDFDPMRRERERCPKIEESFLFSFLLPPWGCLQGK